MTKPLLLRFRRENTAPASLELQAVKLPRGLVRVTLYWGTVNGAGQTAHVSPMELNGGL